MHLDFIHCKFCHLPCQQRNQQGISHAYIPTGAKNFDCDNCQISYIYQDGKQLTQIYNIDNNKYNLIIMDAVVNKTFIYLQGSQQPITIKEVFLSHKMQDALDLLDRVSNLLAFSWKNTIANSVGA